MIDSPTKLSLALRGEGGYMPWEWLKPRRGRKSAKGIKIRIHLQASEPPEKKEGR